jgi:hypothetical protein
VQGYCRITKNEDRARLDRHRAFGHAGSNRAFRNREAVMAGGLNEITRTGRHAVDLNGCVEILS